MMNNLNRGPPVKNIQLPKSPEPVSRKSGWLAEGSLSAPKWKRKFFVLEGTQLKSYKDRVVIFFTFIQ